MRGSWRDGDQFWRNHGRRVRGPWKDREAEREPRRRNRRNDFDGNIVATALFVEPSCLPCTAREPMQHVPDSCPSPGVPKLEMVEAHLATQFRIENDDRRYGIGASRQGGLYALQCVFIDLAVAVT